MQVAASASAQQPLPPLSAAEAARLELECRVRVWGQRVRLLVRHLLSLGRSYEVRYRLPRVVPVTTSPARPLLSLLGFDATSLMDAHLLQVSAVGAAQIPFRVVGNALGVQAEDYLVGLDERDLLVSPLPLAQLRKLAQQLPQTAAAAAPSDAETVLVLRFVRLERLVPTDHARSHGRVLEVLRHILAQHAALVTAYAALLERNRTIVTRELAREKKLLAYVRILAAETQRTVLKHDKFQFAFNFQQWLTALDAIDNDDDDDDDDDDSGSGVDDDVITAADTGGADEMMTADYFEVSDDDDNDNDNDNDTYGDRRETSGHVDVVDLTADARPTAASRHSRGGAQSAARNSRGAATTQRQPPARPPARPPVGGGSGSASRRDTPPAAAAEKPARKPPVAVRDVDMSWMSAFAQADLKWLPQAQPLLRNFISGVVDSFAQDAAVAAHPRVLAVAASVAEQLVRQYIRKRYALSIPNTALQKEFARHVRMLRSNLSNPKNSKLRADLLTGAVATARLCEMTVDELAPETLRLERERRYEQHAQSSMIKEPTGPMLVKTKHGYKEVNFGRLSGSQETDTVASDAVGGSSSASASTGNTAASDEPVAMEEDMEAAPFEYEDEALSVGAKDAIRSQRSPTPPAVIAPGAPAALVAPAAPVAVAAAPKKRVSFAKVLETSAPAPTFESEETTREAAAAAAAAAVVAAAAATEELKRRKPRARKRPVDVKTGRAFLLTLLDPAYDLSESLRMFVETLKDAPLASMSREFVLTSDVKLAHLVVEGASHNERTANIDTAFKLMAALEHFKDRFFELLDQIRQNFGFGGVTVDSRQVRDQVFNFLVHENMVKFIVPPPHLVEQNGVKVEEFDAQGNASWDRGYASERPPTGRDEGAGYRSYSDSRSADASRYYRDREFEDSRDADEARNNNNNNNNDNNNVYRKRRYESGREGWADEPSMARRRMDESGASSAVAVASSASTYPAADEKPLEPNGGSIQQQHGYNATKAEESVPIFYVDIAGEQKPHADREMKALTMEQRIQADVTGYQQLVGQMFADRERVMAALDDIVWDASRETECIMFDDKLNLQAFGKRIVGTSVDSRVDAGGRKATAEFKRIIDLHFARWKVLVRTYGDRKKQTPTTLMAANETRAKNQQYVELKEKQVQHQYECCILVNNHLAIRHACMNQKMAKRSASEEFRDVLDGYLKIEETRRKAPPPPAARVSSSSSTGNAPAQRSQAASRNNRASNLVLCSDDEDDDDRDSGSDDDSSGSEYGDSVPTAVKSDKGQAESAVATSLKELLDNEKALPYDVSSESALSDDARFRATVRSLFTVQDKLCTGIEGLQGSLKYRGSSESEMVPNVRASIQMDRLQEGVYEVRVAVNDVVHFVAREVTKADACTAAIRGVVHKLKSIRAVWVQLLHFFHTRYLGVRDLMQSFHLLRLANITSLMGSLENPPPPRRHDYNHRALPVPGVHCALWVGEHVAFRVVGDTEEEARLLADCYTAKFIMDLINDGLAPEEPTGADTKMVVDDGDDTATRETGESEGSKRRAWSSQIRIRDLIEDTVMYECRVDATWQQEKVPPASEFASEDMVVTQVGKVPIEQLERDLKNWHGSVVTYFSIESPYEQWKLVRHVSAYGHKTRARAFALKLEISPATKYEMYLIPPGASVNSAENLYWPKKVLPRDLADRKEIYGLLKVRHL
ncbi:hypothetical protein PybrP1_005944 [[Pythium] brassicae (nom. inval.)]|nr:hypothetical protein PybrP1_005944 [[Pythium] brassicae (nom. inval.)]